MGNTVFEEWKEQLIEEVREETTIEYYKDGFIPAEKAAEK